MNRLLFSGFAAAAIIGSFFVWGGRTIEVDYSPSASLNNSSLPPRPDGDLPYQSPLPNPPAAVRALYVTNWVAGTPSLLSSVIAARGDSINALIIDIKDFSGYVGFNSDTELVNTYHSRELRIKHLNSLIRDLHEKGFYLIGRLTVFQDPLLAAARPDLAVKTATGQVWRDRHGLSWVDPASPEVWEYNAALSKEIIARGFDEVNFDYIRFPTDGANISSLVYPVWNKEEAKYEVVRRFFAYMRNELPDAVLSADLFGQTTVAPDDIGIGQRLEDAYDYFNYLSPMVYPSHFANGAFGFTNPAAHPYDIIKLSLTAAVAKLEAHESALAAAALATTTPQTISPAAKSRLRAKLRPWLQDFDLGAVYTVDMVKSEIQAVRDAGLSDSWLIWNPSNKYRPAIFTSSTSQPPSP